MKKLFKTTLLIADFLTIGGAVAGYKDHLNNKREGRKARTIYEDGIKRGLDWMCGMVAFIAFWPLYLFIAILVKIKLGSPVLFKQKRPGRDEKLFTLYKFRTMTDEKDEEGNLLPDKDRLTRFGKFLRSSSIDELPEAINIVKGDMSVVGPRPQLVRDMVFMTENQRERHTVRPGLTGLAQVNGRNGISWDEKLTFDAEYINDGISLMEDCKLVFSTLTVILNRKKKHLNITDIGLDYGVALLSQGIISKNEFDDKMREAEQIINL